MAAAGLLASCSASVEPPPKRDWFHEPLVMESASWGVPMARTVIYPDGRAEVWDFTAVGQNSFKQVETGYRAMVPAEALAAFRADFAPFAEGVVQPAGACQSGPTDMPYVTVGPRGGRLLAGYTIGCPDEDAIAYRERLETVFRRIRSAMIVEKAPFQVIKPDA